MATAVEDKPADINLFHCVDLPIADPLNFVNFTECSLAKSFDHFEVLDSGFLLAGHGNSVFVDVETLRDFSRLRYQPP
jgi:hypothetical protein